MIRAALVLVVLLLVGACSASDVPEDPWEERIRGREPELPPRTPCDS